MLLQAMRGSLPGLFAITACDGAMRDAGVADGEVLLLQSTTRVHAGELLAIRLNGSPLVVLRRVRFEDGEAWLQTRDDMHRPIRVERGAVAVVGRVVAISRRAPECAAAIEASAA